MSVLTVLPFKLWVLFVVGATLVTFTKSEFNPEDCSSLGFNKIHLLCSSCDLLKKYELSMLRDHCYECCQHEKQTSTIKRYAKARLEVCTCKFGAYPQIQAFVKSSRPSKFPNLQIRYVRGLDPIIKLLDKDGHVEEVLAIEKWNTDSVEEFLNTHLDAGNDTDSTDYLQTNMV